MFIISAELHCHTTYSDGWVSPQTCIQQARRRGLQVLAITDHNTAEGGLPYWKEPLQNGVLVIPGEEVSTDRGHVLAYFIKETIPPGPFDTVLKQIREQDALAFMAHPYHIPLGNRWRKRVIYKFSPQQLASLDGIEVENGHNRGAANQLAWELAAEKKMVSLSGSDAHLPMEIGNVLCQLTVGELSQPEVRAALTRDDWVQPQVRRWNTYGIYLMIGLLNKLQKRSYAWNPD